MKANRVLSIASLGIAAALAFSGCAATDVVGKVANTSFKAIIAASGDRIAWSDEERSWILKSPAGDEVAFSSSPDMDKPDAEFSFDASPFVAAGLDIKSMPMTDGLSTRSRRAGS